METELVETVDTEPEAYPDVKNDPVEEPVTDVPETDAESEPAAGLDAGDSE